MCPRAEEPDDLLATGIAGYRIRSRIGRGGQAQVYLAERMSDGLPLVLKVLDRAVRDDAAFRKRLVREYRLIAAIHNEFVARIYDQGFAGEDPYIAMEYLPGGTLAVKMHEGLGSRDAIRIAAQVARALDAIHSLGVVHRDLKPQNIMFRADGRAVLVDFGLAREFAKASDITRVGEVLATPRYISPEQCLGLPADPRSDLYSLGAILYEMLAGQPPFAASNNAQLVLHHLHTPPPRLPARLAGYQPVLDRLLAKKPEERFQTARELFATIAI